MSFYPLDQFTQQDKLKFCQLIADGFSVRNACQQIGISLSTYYYHLNEHKPFKAQIQAAKTILCDDLESAMVANGKTPRGSTDRIAYLKAYSPAFKDEEKEETHLEININLTEDKLKEYENRIVELGQDEVKRSG